MGDRWIPGWAAASSLLLTLEIGDQQQQSTDWVKDKVITFFSFLWSRGFLSPHSCKKKVLRGGKGPKEGGAASPYYVLPTSWKHSCWNSSWLRDIQEHSGRVSESGQIWAQARWLAKDSPEDDPCKQPSPLLLGTAPSALRFWRSFLSYFEGLTEINLLPNLHFPCGWVSCWSVPYLGSQYIEHTENTRRMSLKVCWSVSVVLKLWSFEGCLRVAFRGSVSQNSFHGNIKTLLAFSTIYINTNYAKTIVKLLSS